MIKVMESILAIIFLLVLSNGCGGAEENSSSPTVSSEQFVTYKVEVVDDTVIGSSISAKGCKNSKSEGAGIYTFECSTPPAYIVANGGFVDINRDGKQDENETSMGLPLLLNLDETLFDVNLSNIVVTPLSTLVANVQSRSELIELASKLGINNKDFNKDISSSHKELFQKLNSLLIVASNNGINNQFLLIKKLREEIKISSFTAIGDILLRALENLKDDEELKREFGQLFISGFINESSRLMNSGNVLIDIAEEYKVEDGHIIITGFIYDSVIKNANISIFDGLLEVGSIEGDENGRWKISIIKSILDRDSVLLFTGTATDANGDKILLKSAITTMFLREVSKNRLSVSDTIDLVISNVTTAQVAILDKNDKDFLQKPYQLEEKKNKIEVFQQEVLLKASAAIKAIIDGGTRINDNENTYSFIVNKLIVIDAKNDTVRLDLNGSISENEINIQSNVIKNDAILSQQLLSIESDKSLKPILNKSLYNIEYTGVRPIKKYKKLLLRDKSIVEKSYVLEENTWKEVSSKVFLGTSSEYIFYLNETNNISPMAITLKEVKKVYSSKLNKNYTFNILGRQLYKPYKTEDTKKVNITIYSESFDLVTVFKELAESKITNALVSNYTTLSIEEQNLFLSRLLINEISKAPESFNRNTTKLNEAITILENTDFVNDDISVKLNEVKSVLNSASSNDKDAQVGKAIFALAEITNSPSVGEFFELTLDGRSVGTSDNLPSIIETGTGKELEAQLVESLSDLSDVSMKVLHETVLKLGDINKTLGENFAESSYTFSYKDVTLTHHQSLLLRVSILGVASKLEYLTAFDYVDLEDIKTRTASLNAVTAEYKNFSANPLSVFNRSEVGVLNSTVGAIRLSHAKALLLESIDILSQAVASEESDLERRQNLVDAQVEAVKIKASLMGLSSYVIKDEKYNGNTKNIYVNLSALYSAATALDMTHTVGHNFSYESEHIYFNGKEYESGAFNLGLSQFYNEPMSDKWLDKNGTSLTYVDGQMPRPTLNMNGKVIPTGGSSHIPALITKVEVLESGEPDIVNTGDNVIKYIFNHIEINRPNSYQSFAKSEDVDLFYSVRTPLVPDSVVRYGVEFLYGGDKFEFVSLDPLKGEVHVVGKAGFTGQQCFGVDVYDTLGHSQEVNECVYISETVSTNAYNSAQALDKSLFPSPRYVNTIPPREFKTMNSNTVVRSIYDISTSTWSVEANLIYHFEGNALVIDSDNDGIEDYRIKYLRKITDVQAMNDEIGGQVFRTGAVAYEFIKKSVDGSINQFYQVNSIGKDQYMISNFGGNKISSMFNVKKGY